MGQLHQVLAVEGSLGDEANKALAETKVTLSKPENFIGGVKILEMFKDDRQKENSTEHRTVAHKARAVIDGMLVRVGNYWDAVFQKETANQSARADIILSNGVVLITNVPATFLLGLETKLKALKDVLATTPVLAPTTQWETSPAMEAGVWQSKGRKETFKTEKSYKVQILAPATDKHPAQVDKIPVDEVIGKYLETQFSGAITPDAKAGMMARLDDLIVSVRKARARANEQEVSPYNGIGKVLLDYVVDGTTNTTTIH